MILNKTAHNSKLLVLLFLASSILPYKTLAQVSSDGKIKIEDKEHNLVINYKNDNEWHKIMSITADVVSKSPTNKHKVKYEMLVGKRSKCENQYNEITYNLTNSGQLIVRVYNDGVAWNSFGASQIDISSAKNNWLQKWSEGYEDFFPKNRNTNEGNRWGYPALFEFDNNIYTLLSESDILNTSAGSSMFSTAKTGVFDLRPDGNEMPGWQTAIIGSLSDVVESTLITDNSESCKLTDTSWIHPGVASWVYWAYNHGSNDYNIIKKYIDMAVELKLPYVLIDAEWDEMKFGKTIEDAVKYATDNNIKPIIWYNSSVGWVNGAPGPKYRLNKPEDREKEFEWCEKIGIKGVKIDFFSGDTNLNMKYMIELLECAARHHLLVNFHGATLPRGWQRTYPNLISTEGVYGAEWYNNVPTFTKKAAAHNATLPFTRNVVGSMDYTPCAFSDSQHPHITTHAHELALTALFESGIQHLADRPESFLSQPQTVKDYLTNLPTAWDETHLISGYPGESVVIARKKGTRWYIAGINGKDEEQTLDLSSVSLLKIKYKNMTIFADSDNTESPWNITETGKNKADIPLKMKCQPRGGFIIVLNNN